MSKKIKEIRNAEPQRSLIYSGIVSVGERIQKNGDHERSQKGVKTYSLALVKYLSLTALNLRQGTCLSSVADIQI